MKEASASQAARRVPQQQLPPPSPLDASFTLPLVRLNGNSSIIAQHRVYVVISDVHKFVYVANLKAASSSITEWLTLHAGGRNLCYKNIRNMSHGEAQSSCCDWPNGQGLLTSHCLGPQHAEYFFFSFVRDPVTKFESGVRELWVRSPTVRHHSADQMLHLVLRKTAAKRWGDNFPVHSSWTDQHLEPNWWRLSGETGVAARKRNGSATVDEVGRLGLSLGAQSISLDGLLTYAFLGRCEHFEEDWNQLL